MSTSLNDLEKAINSGLTTAVKKSEIGFGQLYIDINIEDITEEDVKDVEILTEKNK